MAWLLSLALVACGGGDDRGTTLPAVDATTVAATATVAVSTIPAATASTAATATVVVATTTVPATTTVADTGSIPACSQAGQRYWLRSLMDDQYYWYAQQGQANEAASDMDGYFQSLLYRPTDRYSYTQTSDSFVQTFSVGRRTGYGYTLVWADAAQTVLRVLVTEPLSPVAAAGLKRGDTVLSIDGFTPAQIFAGAVGAVDQAGIARRFQIRDASGAERSFTVVSADFAVSPVLTANTFSVSRNGKSLSVGYLAYQQFVDYSAAALGQAFAAYAQAGVQELILDLRYNGGGSVNMALKMASMMGGASVAGKVFARLNYNALHPEKNAALNFTSDATLLPAAALAGLTRVFVITSGSTASASELVINSLRPFMSVVLIGATTYGKPYGFEPRAWCGINYNAVNFEAVNAAGQGGYINGIAANCNVADDLDHQLGDPAEVRTQAAINYAFTGACPASAAGSPGAAALAAGRGGVADQKPFGESWPAGMFRR